MTKETWFLIAGAIEVVATIWYLVDTLHGDTRPHWFSWLGFAAIGTVGAIASFRGGGGPGAYVSATFAVSAFSVFIVAALSELDIPWMPIRNKDRDPASRIEWAVGLFAIACLALEATTSGPPPLYATIGWVGDACFAWFTLDQAYHNPKKENPSIWGLSTVAAVFGVFALNSHNYSALAYPLYLVIGNGLITAVDVVRRSKLSGHTKGAST